MHDIPAISHPYRKVRLERSTMLTHATARFSLDPEGAYAEQQRLLKRKLEFKRRLMQMAAARADASA